MNTLMIIYPYRKNGTWMFDDAATGLREEPFISGIPEIIEFATAQAGIKNPEDGFKLLFSATPFPGYQAILRLAQWRAEDCGGNWYQLEGTELEGWLCPALFKYFDYAPKTIYCQLSEKEAAAAA
jgi:hypothetical protein